MTPLLTYRDTELKLIEKVALSHDYQGGELNVSLVDIHNSTTNEGYIACVEKCIKALTLEEMQKEQTFMTTLQTDMELEGDFAITQGISPLEIICPLYLFFSVVSYCCAKYLVEYFTNYTIKQNYTSYNRYRLVCSIAIHSMAITPLSLSLSTSLHQATMIGLSYFLFIFGLMGIITHLTKYALAGKPRHRFMKIFYFYGFLCVGIGAAFSVYTVHKLDPDQLQYILKDANMVPHFLRIWAKSAMFAMGVAIFYGIPLYVVYMVLINLIFKEYSTN